MNSFLFAFDAVSPIILMVATGYFLKRIGLIPKELVKPLNKLVFQILLPVMLFLNVYKLDSLQNIEFGYILFACAATVGIFLISIPLVVLVTKQDDRRGVLLQATFRSNHALIGVVLAQALFGAEGVQAASFLSAFIIPVYNILAVLSLSVFQKDGGKINIKKILSGIVKNPLILGVVAGIAVLGIRALFSQAGISFRLSNITSVFKVLEYLSNLATPLALLVLGAQFEFSAVSALKKEIIFGTLMRTVVAPILGLGISFLFFRNSFSGAQFAVLIAIFATPVAVSTVPMAQEMKGDVILAGQLVVWTTILSAFSVFLSSYLLRLAGILS